MAKVLGFTIEIQGTKVAVDTTNQLREAMKKLQSEMGNVSDKELFEKMSKEASKLKAELKAVTDQQRNFVREIEAGKTGTGSYQQLNAELVKLRQNYKKLSEEERSSKVGQETIKNIQNLDKKLKDIDKSMGQFQRNVGNYPNTILSGIGSLAPSLSGITNTITDIGAAAGRTGKLIAGAFGVLGIILVSGQQLFAANSKIEETQADVRKTANLSADSVNRLTESLKGLPTRTTLDDLLKIGAALGQLGVVVNKDTISAIDTLNVALRGELGSSAEEVATKIGILRNLFDDIQTSNVADDYLKLGNALNVAGASGAATADVVQDFAVRIAGTSRALGLTSGQILGLSASMQEAGVNVERGSTGIENILTQLAKAPESFAKVFKLPVAQFKKLTEDDLVGAFVQVVQKMKELTSTGGDVIRTLDALEISGKGEREVFLKLAKNIDEVIGKNDLLTKSLKEQNSIQQENAIKQQTLGAIWERTWNKIANSAVSTFVTNSLKGLGLIIEKSIDALGYLRDTYGFGETYAEKKAAREKDQLEKDKAAAIEAKRLYELRLEKNAGLGITGETDAQKNAREAREKKIADAAKKVKDAALKTESEYQAELLKLLSIYNDLKIELIGDEYEKEIAVVEKQYQDRIKSINDKAKIDGLNPTKSKQVNLQRITDELLAGEVRNKGLAEIDKKKNDAAFKAQQDFDIFFKNRQIDEDKALDDAIDKTREINDKADKDKIAAKKKTEEELAKIAEDARQKEFDNALLILDTIGSIAGEIGNFIDQLNQQQLDAMDEQIAKQTDKLDSLQEKMGETTGAARVELARQIENEKAALAQSNAQKAEAEKKAARERQRIAIIQGVIDTASGILAATARGDVFGAIAAGIVGAIQIATISAQAFAQGGKVLSGERVNSNSGARIRRSNGDNVLATVRTGEVVLNEQQQARLGGARTFKKIGVPGFATGGYTGDPLPRPSQDYLSGVTGGVASNNELRSLISAIDARFDRLQVHVVGEDVANELNAQSKAKKAAVI